MNESFLTSYIAYKNRKKMKEQGHWVKQRTRIASEDVMSR